MIGLPGGSEEEALSLGFARIEARGIGRREGYSRASIDASETARRLVKRANQFLVQDTSNAYIVLQPELNGPFARAINLPTLRAEFASDLRWEASQIL